MPHRHRLLLLLLLLLRTDATSTSSSVHPRASVAAASVPPPQRRRSSSFVDLLPRATSSSSCTTLQFPRTPAPFSPHLRFSVSYVLFYIRRSTVQYTSVRSKVELQISWKSGNKHAPSHRTRARAQMTSPPESVLYATPLTGRVMTLKA